MQYRDPPPDWTKAIAGLDPASPTYVNAVNRYLEDRTADLIEQLSFHGINWIGIVHRDDRRVGLSGGGFRATYMAGMDPRIRAAVIVGWMSTLPSIARILRSTHSDMYQAFGLHAFLDHPDVATLGAPQCATFVQNCARDGLFTRDGMADAVNKIRNVCVKEGRPERFRAETYDVPHSFKVAMQEDAFGWLEKWLK